VHVNCNGTSCLLLVGEESPFRRVRDEVGEKATMKWKVFPDFPINSPLLIVSRPVTDASHSMYHTRVEALNNVETTYDSVLQAGRG